MTSKLARVAALFLIVSLVAGPAADAGTASISIDSVGGNKIRAGSVSGSLRGGVLVQGTAIPGGATPSAPAAKPLVADAGDSSFVGGGGAVTLLGAGFGGTAPYTFAWTTTAGALTGADAPTAQISTTGIAAGTYSATLTVRDQNGASASDSVKFVVYAPEAKTLLRADKADGTPGVLGVGVPGTVTIPFSVPAGMTKFDILVTWDVPTNDYDLRVLRPDGSEGGRKGNNPGVPEDVTVTDPVAGTWTLALDKFATVPDTLHATVQGIGAPADPRPVVQSGGPYRFSIGTAQAVAATVSGGAAPVSIGWDTDEDGTLDRTGASFTGSFGEGRRIITAKATDANGLERRSTTSVLVARADRVAAETTPITIVAVNDTGVNPYHLEYSALTYPDPDVLALTNNFQRHPSEYIAGYPKDAQAIRATLGQGYFPEADRDLWSLKSTSNPNGLEFGRLYWIPGTKIVGAIQAGTYACSNCRDGAHVILDDDGHGSGSTSVSVGNRYGYCGSCLLVVSKGLSTAFAPTSTYDWVDVNSNSWGAVANVPLDLLPVFANQADISRAAVERGQTVLFAAGNGNGNAFESPSPTYGTSTTGPDWNVVVGAIRREGERAIIGEGTPAHLSSWGDGNLPSACRTGTVSQCAFGGTSAATPYTAGVFGNVLSEVRRQIGDGANGQRPGQIVAEGFPTASGPLADGTLTRAELREAVLKTAFPLKQDATQNISIYPFPWTAPYQGDINVLFEGYGAATPNSAKRAINVLLGKAAMPVREAEDRWFAIDRQIRDSIWGGYDRDGNGTTDHEAPVGAFGVTAASFASADLSMLAIKKITDQMSASLTQTTGSNPLVYWLHRSSEGEPGAPDGCANAVTYMDQTDSDGDFDPCFENRATTLLAAYRPIGIWPTSIPSDVALAAGTRVDVEFYIATDQVTLVRPTGVLMAGDRVLGTGAGTPSPTIGSGPWIAQGLPVNPNVVNGAPAIPTGVAIDQNKCRDLGELCWNKLTWSFTTTRPSIPGEYLTFQVQAIGARAWSFGYEGQHRSKITITPADVPASLGFSVAIAEPTAGSALNEDAFNALGTATFPALGTTEAGDHPTRKRVDVSVDDASFTAPIEATLTLNGDETSGSWWAPIPGLTPGTHTLYVRASIDRTTSPVAQVAVTVQDTRTSPRVQWQVVPAGQSTIEAGWKPATGVLSYQFAFDTAAYGTGDFDIHTRLLEAGVPTAATSIRAKFR